MKEFDFFEIASLREDCDVEFKSNARAKGSNKLSRSIWETYSSMANTYGGYIYLGIEEDIKHHTPIVVGIKNPERLKKELCDALNNPQKVSVNILRESDIVVETEPTTKKKIIRIHIPQATRKQRPVYINGNPIIGTYRRNYESDYRCNESTVKQMLADQMEDTKDSILIDNYDLDDLNPESLKAYRQVFASRQPNHPFIELDDRDFLRNIGGWIEARDSNRCGLTLAGLLMFGKLRSILDVVPNYIVDYQEHSKSFPEQRWIDRITTDFTWSGNIYDFYRKIIQKLTADLKIPFQIVNNERMDDSLVHQALREALVNTLIHADYSGRLSILIIKHTDLFEFRNPGIFRISTDNVIRGGCSDCRNRTLQKMFQLIGLGEQAGSGIPKIYDGWSSQHWKAPVYQESIEKNQITLQLPTTSLLPENDVNWIKDRLSDEVFDNLTNTELIALTTAKTERSVTHQRLKEFTGEHAADLTKILHGLVEKHLLLSEGYGRGTFYYFEGNHPFEESSDITYWTIGGQRLMIGKHYLVSSKDKGMGVINSDESSEHSGDSSEHYSGNSEHSGDNSEHYSGNSEHYSGNSEHKLHEIASKVNKKGRISKELMHEIIYEMCKIKPLTNKEIASLVKRKEDSIRVHYLNPMCKDGFLEKTHPNIINHPNQKYKAKAEDRDDDLSQGEDDNEN